MGRPRKNKKDNVLPPRVRSNGYSYVWKPEGSTRSIGLGRVRKTSVDKVWQNYELEKAKLHNIMTVAKLWHMFMDSPAFTELAPRTQKDYRQHQKALLMVFGKVLADNVKTEQVRIFMDKRGLESKTHAKESENSLLKPALFTSPMNSMRRYMRKQFHSYALQWRFPISVRQDSVMCLS